MRGEKFRPVRPGTRLLLLLGALLWLAACSAEEPAPLTGNAPTTGNGPGHATGGTGSEAGDAYGALRIGDTARIAAYAAVTLFRSAEPSMGHPKAVARTTADSLGRYRFPSVAAGRYDVEFHITRCECPTEGIHYRRDVRIAGGTDQDLGGDTLLAPAFLRGRLAAADPGTYVRLAGTPYASAPDSTGVWRMRGLPRGEFTLIAERLAEGDSVVRTVLRELTLRPGDSLDLNPDPPVPVDTVPQSPGGWLLVDDFDDGDALSALGGAWSLWAKGTGHLAIPASQDFADAILMPGAYSGRGVNIHYVVPAAPNASNGVYIDLELGSGATDPRIVESDTLSFQYRGDGRIRLEVTWSAQGVEQHNIWLLEPGTGWTHAKVFLGGMWPDGRKPDSLKRIRILPNSGNILYLDQFRLFVGAR